MSILDQAFNQLIELLPKLGSEKRRCRSGHHRHRYHRRDHNSHTFVSRVYRWSGFSSSAAITEVPEQSHSISLLPVSAAVAHASCHHHSSRVVHEQLLLTYVHKRAHLSSPCGSVATVTSLAGKMFFFWGLLLDVIALSSYGVRRPGPRACHVMSLSNSDDDDDFVTPLQSLHTSRLGLATPLSRTTSLYLSASDIPILESCAAAGCSAAHILPRGTSAGQLGDKAPGTANSSSEEHNSAHMDDLQLITHQNHPSPETDDHHELTAPQLNGPNYSFTFRDGMRSIDYVLVWQESSSNIDNNPVEEERQLTAQQLQKRQQKKDMLDMHAKRRKIFEGKLMEEGIVLEEDQVSEVPLRFVKIHAPMEVCCRYAEILKLRMPMKEKVDQCFLKQRFILHFPGLPALEISAPAVLQDVSDVISRMFNFVRNNPAHFPPMDRHFNAVYSRDKEYLFNVNEDFFNAANRARIIDFILRRKRFCAEDEEDDFAFGIEKLLNDGTYIAAYPIHEGDVNSGQNARVILFKHWASIRNFYKYQPLDHIKRYFGVKIALYFAWLGFYTYMLIPASIVGFLCFLYAASTINLHQPSNDICNKELARSIEMCPLCDTFCGYWNLNDTCFHAKFTYLVDNPATVFFAVFMSFWGERCPGFPLSL
ncbi:Anoctamin dimerization domain [Trinorchestia longiramus]|nr:Anoctamin dimerization domain [Trinorchestia longiramus]